jgi:PST family polysaccharide transporter
MFKWGVILSAAACLSFLIGLPFGPTGVALAYSLTIIALTIPSVMYACRTIPLRATQVFSTVLPPIGASVAAGVCAYGTRILAEPSTANGIVPAVGVFFLTYLVFVLPWPGPRETIAFALQKFVTAR